MSGPLQFCYVVLIDLNRHTAPCWRQIVSKWYHLTCCTSIHEVFYFLIPNHIQHFSPLFVCTASVRAHSSSLAVKTNWLLSAISGELFQSTGVTSFNNYVFIFPWSVAITLGVRVQSFQEGMINVCCLAQPGFMVQHLHGPLALYDSCSTQAYAGLLTNTHKTHLLKKTLNIQVLNIVWLSLWNIWVPLCNTKMSKLQINLLWTLTDVLSKRRGKVHKPPAESLILQVLCWVSWSIRMSHE